MRRLLIRDAAIVSMDPAIGELRQGDILVEEERIAAPAPTLTSDGVEIIDASRMLALPGLINGHLSDLV
jgi:cytosine/adenosine deaminase-related metal-dependent hydrolase